MRGYRRRKPPKKRTRGQQADRNPQFEKIAQLKEEYVEAGQSVISIDTKKKEMLGPSHSSRAIAMASQMRSIRPNTTSKKQKQPLDSRSS